MMKRRMSTLILTIFFCFGGNVFADSTYVAEIDGVKYETLSQAITAAGSQSTTIKLINNINLDGKVSFPKGSNIILDLNGKILNVPTVENNYGVVVGGNLTVKGSGTVNVGMYGIGVQPTGNLIIKSGTYRCLSGDYLLGCWGTATIEGGLFDGNYCIANGFNNGTIKILDGTFYNKESTIVLGGVTIFSGAFNQNVDEYLADGIEMNKYEGLYYVGKIYKINVEQTKNGSVNTLMEAVAEQPVKVTTTANKGYQLDEVKVIDANGKILAVSNSEFIMPSSDVTVYVTFEADTLDETPSTGNNLLVLIPAGLVFIMTIIIILDKRYKDI